MPTHLVYLEDPYLKTLKANLLQILPDKEGIWCLLTDQTIFYPLGGGQPTDQGTIQLEDGSIIPVFQVLYKNGEVYHYIKCITPPSPQSIILSIDWNRRYQNMRVHSAGHIVDFALYQLGYSPKPLFPLKGDHGKKPHIIYAGTLSTDIRVPLEKKANQLVEQNLHFTWNFASFEGLQKDALYLQPGLPTHKPLRKLHLESIGSVADGGTIVATTKEVGPIVITSIQTVEDQTIIYYTISPNLP